MLKNIALFLLVFCSSQLLVAQQIVSVGSNYQNQTYYSFAQGSIKSVPLDAWDVAIETAGDYAIRINEAIGTRLWVKTTDIRQNCTLGTNCRGLQDYIPSNYDTTGMMNGQNSWVELHNDYTSWKEGAFNQEDDPAGGHVLDYGWGAYKAFSSDPAHAIIGYRIFIIQLADGKFKQFFVRKSTSSGYEFAYADLDGSNVQDFVIDRNDYANKLFAYHNIRTSKTDSLDPNNDEWDLLLTAYPANKAQGDLSKKLGFLHNHGYETAELEGVDVNCANSLLFDASIDVIGHDWYYSNPSCGCRETKDSLLYIVKDPAGVENRMLILQRDSFAGTVSVNTSPNNASSLNLSIAKQDESCANCNNGAANAFVSGGTCPYTYSWSNGASTKEINGLAPNWYVLTVTDQNGNSIKDSIEILSFQCELQVDSFVIQKPSCFGASDGSLTAIISGGTGPFSYTWNTGEQTAQLNNLSAGNYSVTVSDANNCQASLSINLNQPLALTGNIEQVAPTCPSCKDAALIAHIQGGTKPFSYSWSNGQNDSTASNLAQGQYTVTITDANGCSLSLTDITKAFECLLALKVKSAKQPSCFGGTDGNIILEGLNSAGYTYAINNAAFQSNPEFTGLPAGEYLFKVQDQNGCLDSLTFSLSQPSELGLEINLDSVSCYKQADGQISLNGLGGTAPYLFSLNGANPDTVSVFSGLEAGNYFLMVQDAKGCTYSEVFLLEEPDSLQMQLQTQIASCGFADGAIQVIPQGGTAPYFYSLDGSNYQDSNKFENLPAGTFAVWLKDKNNCVAIDTAIIGNPAALQLSISQKQDVSCFNGSDGSFIVSVSGGSAPYQFRLNQGNYQANAAFQSLSAGTYQVEVLDASGCSAITQVQLNQPAELTMQLIKQDISCNGEQDGSLQIQAFGGTAPYQLSLNGSSYTGNLAYDSLASGWYIINIQDANGCEAQDSTFISEPALLDLKLKGTDNLSCHGSLDGKVFLTGMGGTAPYEFSINQQNWQSDSSFTQLAAGSYTVYLRDARFCVDSTSFSLNQPAKINLSIQSFSHVSCNGGNDGSFAVQASGGQGNLVYSLDGVNYQSSNSFVGLSAGNHTYYVKDDSSCVQSSIIQITEPAPIAITQLGLSAVSCYGSADGAVAIDASGGTAPYLFSIDSINWQGNGSFNNLPAGTYNISVKDSKQCIQTHQVQINSPDSLYLQLVGRTHIECFGDSTGEIFVLAQGGVAPYTYSINGGTAQQNGGFGDLKAGLYTLEVFDDNSCLASITVELNENPAIVANISTSPASCANCFDGSAWVETSGGSGELSLFWTTGSQADSIAQLKPGAYELIITDSLGCQIRDTAFVGNSFAVVENMKAEIKLYPNPAREMLHVKSNVPMERVEVYSLNGELLISQAAFHAQDKAINLDELATGTYLLRIIGDGSENRLFIKQ